MCLCRSCSSFGRSGGSRRSVPQFGSSVAKIFASDTSTAVAHRGECSSPFGHLSQTWACPQGVPRQIFIVPTCTPGNKCNHHNITYNTTHVIYTRMANNNKNVILNKKNIFQVSILWLCSRYYYFASYHITILLYNDMNEVDVVLVFLVSAMALSTIIEWRLTYRHRSSMTNL